MKRRLLVVLFIIIAIVLFIAIRNIIKNNENIEHPIDEIVENSIDYIQFEDFNELGLKVAEKNGDWSKYHLSKNFLNKYNEKNGIFGNMKFDKVEYKPYSNGKYSFEDYSYLVLTQGLKKTAYIFTMVNGSDGYDIVFGDMIELTDENGQELDAKVTINKDNFTRTFYMLSRGGADEQSISVTDHFHKKYPYFLDLFIHYSPLEFNEIIFNGGNFEDRVVNFIVDSRLECVKREYEVKFKIDERGYLDDAEAICIKTEYYERESLVYPWGAQVFFKNSNWDNLKITNKFRNKYNSNDGCFFDIDNIDINLWVRNSESIDLYTSICDYAYNNGGHKWFCKKQFNDKNGYLDDIEFIPIDYTGNDPNAAKEIYIKSINK